MIMTFFVQLISTSNTINYDQKSHIFPGIHFAGLLPGSQQHEIYKKKCRKQDVFTH